MTKFLTKYPLNFGYKDYPKIKNSKSSKITKPTLLLNLEIYLSTHTVYPKKLPPKSFRKSTQMVKELGFSLTHEENERSTIWVSKKSPEKPHFRGRRRRP